jgi:hypothetical protein
MLPVGVALLAILGSTAPMDVRADAVQDSRAAAGARVFRRVLVNDEALAGRLEAAGASGARIVVLHAGDAGRAAKLADVIAQRDAAGVPEPLKSRAVRVDVVGVDGLATLNATVAGVFVAQPLSRRQLDAARARCAELRALCFSPFEGDVEGGLAVGLWLGEQMKILVNVRAAEASGVRFSDAFLSHAVRR